MSLDGVLQKLPFLKKPLEYAKKISDLVLMFVGNREMQAQCKLESGEDVTCSRGIQELIKKY